MKNKSSTLLVDDRSDSDQDQENPNVESDNDEFFFGAVFVETSIFHARCHYRIVFITSVTQTGSLLALTVPLKNTWIFSQLLQIA